MIRSSDFQIGADRHARDHFLHFGVDEVDALFARHRHPMMPVHDKVRIAHFVQAHRRQIDIAVKGARDALPAVRRAVLLGQKHVVEVAIAIDAADDLRHRHGFHAAIDRPAQFQRLLDRFIRQAVDSERPDQSGHDIAPPRSAAHAAIVAFGSRDDMVARAESHPSRSSSHSIN